MLIGNIRRAGLAWLAAGLWMIAIPAVSQAQAALESQKFYDNERVWKSDDPKYNFRRSEHFRVIWGKGVGEGNVNNDYGLMNEQRVQGHLQSLENIWHRYHDPEPLGLGFHFPGDSTNPEQNDGKLYRCNFAFNNTGIWEGGAWGATDEAGYQLFAINPGFTSYDPPTGATAHEYGHTIQINAGGFNDTPYDGMWHEASANWLDMQYIDDQDVGPMPTTRFFSLPHGRDYYHCWQIWEYLREQPKYGVKFFNTMWTQANGNKAKGGEYIFDAMARLDPSGAPDAYNTVKDNLGHTAEHCVTWDFERGPFFRAEAPLVISPTNDNYRRGMSEVVRVTGDKKWYRVPFEQAPSQGGYDFIPIKLEGKKGGGYQVGIDFRPLWDPTRGSDWRACFVAVNDNGEPRYGNQWNVGVNSITLAADENKLFLVVTAVPDFMGFEGFARPLISDQVLAPQSYQIAFVNTKAVPFESGAAEKPEGVSGKAHANGGGFVADTAKVDATAYVGPNAMVLGSAQVLGNARLEDFAVVSGNAVVKDNTVISGHGMVRDNAEVSGNAKVRDWATVTGGWKVYDNARVLEHAYLVDRGQLHENAAVKGSAADFGNCDVKGYAIKDGDCSNGANLDKSVLMCWVWGTDQEYANSRPDTGGVYANYNFEKTSPNYAMDMFGVTHGYLMGGTKVVQVNDAGLHNALQLDGKTGYIELRKDLFDVKDATYALWVKWNGGAAGQKLISFGSSPEKYMVLTPKDSTGKAKFVITATGKKGEQSLSAPALPTDTWTHVAITLKGDTGTLFINGTAAATGAITVHPDALLGPNTRDGGTYAYLGRGSDGSYFSGLVEDFRVYTFAQPESVITAAAKALDWKAAIVPSSSAPGTIAPAKFKMNPTAISDTAVTMTAERAWQPGKAIEYYFQCTSGGGHDSGWISGSSYTDCLLKSATKYTYVVRVREDGRTVSAESSPVSVTTPADTAAPNPPTAAFEAGPIGISDGAIKMTAAKATDINQLLEYKFTRSDGKTTGWQSSRNWTDTGVKAGQTYSYTVQARDGRGNVNVASAAKSATARDDNPPARFVKGEWVCPPYALIDNRISLHARPLNSRAAKIEDDPVEYYYHCASGGGPDSGWIDDPAWSTPVLPDGTYVYEFKMRDKSPQKNETGYSQQMTVKVSNMTGYHDYKLADLAALPEGALVTFSGKVTDVGDDYYVVTSDGASVKVMPNTKGSKTDAALSGKDVTVNGGMWIVSGEKRVTWCDVKPAG